MVTRVTSLVMLLALVTVGCAASAAADPAPPFSLELFDGKTFSLAGARGKAVVLLFWAPW